MAKRLAYWYRSKHKGVHIEQSLDNPHPSKRLYFDVNATLSQRLRWSGNSSQHRRRWRARPIVALQQEAEWRARILSDAVARLTDSCLDG